MTTDGFAEHQERLFAVAYRMLASVAEAEDVVQDTYLRWSSLDDPDAVRSPGAYLTTVTTRLAIDRLRSAQHRRETYVGPWLAEPLVEDADPADATELADSLTTAFLLLLERLNPVERAVFLLHEVFGYGYDEVATVVERPASTCRTIGSRARARVADGRRRRFEAGPDEEQRLLAAFAGAASAGDLDGLMAVLTEDVVLWSDGGAARHAARRPVTGPDRVARFVTTVTRRLPARTTVAPARLNGDPGLVVSTSDGTPYLTLSVEPDPSGRIRAVHVVLNPDKLRHLHR